jgi:hypothetical protein
MNNDENNGEENEVGNELPTPGTYQSSAIRQPDCNTDIHRPPLQFGLGSLLWLMVAVGLIFGTLQWMWVSVLTSLIVMAVLGVSALAVVLLVAAIAKIED